jgi:hypothetical protein
LPPQFSLGTSESGTAGQLHLVTGIRVNVRISLHAADGLKNSVLKTQQLVVQAGRTGKRMLLSFACSHH